MRKNISNTLVKTFLQKIDQFAREKQKFTENNEFSLYEFQIKYDIVKKYPIIIFNRQYKWLSTLNNHFDNFLALIFFKDED